MSSEGRMAQSAGWNFFVRPEDVVFFGLDPGLGVESYLDASVLCSPSGCFIGGNRKIGCMAHCTEVLGCYSSPKEIPDHRTCAARAQLPIRLEGGGADGGGIRVSLDGYFESVFHVPPNNRQKFLKQRLARWREVGLSRGKKYLHGRAHDHPLVGSLHAFWAIRVDLQDFLFKRRLSDLKGDSAADQMDVLHPHR